MATDIETKIVEAQFRSEDFDKNIRKSTKNLEDFKRSLRFDDAANQMRQVTEQGESMMGVFTNMASNIEKLSNGIYRHWQSVNVRCPEDQVRLAGRHAQCRRIHEEPYNRADAGR